MSRPKRSRTRFIEESSVSESSIHSEEEITIEDKDSKQNKYTEVSSVEREKTERQMATKVECQFS